MAWGPGPGCDRVAIIGLGQIGSSMGLAVKEAGLAREVIGHDINPGSADCSVAMGAVNSLASSPEDAARGSDLVILAVPVGEMASSIQRVAGVMEAGSLLTDTGSFKGDVVATMDRLAGGRTGYVGGHPMAGCDLSGPESASAATILGCRYILCPGPRTGDQDLRRLHAFLEAIPVSPVVMSPSDHDRRMAWVSHLPYMTAVGLCLAVENGLCEDAEALDLVAGSFRDGTRVAASDPAMAGDYCFANRARVVTALRALCGELEQMATALEAGDRIRFDRLLVAARNLKLRAGR